MFWLWTIGAGIVGYLIGSRSASDSPTAARSVGAEFRPRQLSPALLLPPPVQSMGRAMVRASPGIHLREAPGGAILDEIKRGEIVEVITSSSAPGSWWQVRSPRGTIGYALGVNGGGDQNIIFLDTRASQVMLSPFASARNTFVR